MATAKSTQGPTAGTPAEEAGEPSRRKALWNQNTPATVVGRTRPQNADPGGPRLTNSKYN